ncbi:MAG: aminoacyl-histidine dipeptidase [Clostridiales bacterium]|nr:aminoacyl-histidine dipeptidase [Clostridiales bacterium]
MKKQIICLLLTLTLSLTALTACANTKPNPQDSLADRAFAIFVELSCIPRGSGNMQGISDWLVAFGQARGLETIQDQALNVLIKKPGSKGREHEPPIALQAHMDMVCQKDSDVQHDFLTDPIIPIIEGDWVMAQGTTLGADDGAGVAMILAVLDADNLSHPPIEAVLTTNEETDMSGALGFDTSLLAATRMINLDNEVEGMFCVSSAGGTQLQISLPLETVATPEGLLSLRLTVQGLTGGHSGVEIHKGLANANILMAQVLRELSEVTYYVSDLEGGSADNAIPRACTVVLSFAEKDLAAVQAIVARTEAAFMPQYTQDANLAIEPESADTPQTVWTTAATQRVLDCILQLPDGVIAMSPDVEGLVQTSSNLGIVKTQGNELILCCYPRSSSPTDQADTLDKLTALAEAAGGALEIISNMPAWPYRADSPLREALIAVYTALYEKEPRVEAVHAGLESGAFAKSKPALDIISIGPDLLAVHTPGEKLSLSSFNRTCDFLIEILKQI